MKRLPHCCQRFPWQRNTAGLPLINQEYLFKQTRPLLTTWNRSEDPPSTLSILVKAAGVPIDRYSNEQIEYLRDIEARWDMMREVKDLPAVQRISKKNSNAALEAIRRVPQAKIYTINVSFAGVPDAEERDYLNELPTSFVLTDEAVDRLRAGAAKALMNSPDFKRLVADTNIQIVESPTTATAPANRQ